MANWTAAQPCPTCGRVGGTRVMCSNCNTVGCSNGNCMTGPSPLGFCKICNKQTKKVKL
jgi:uncharacterized protein (DUF2237 family)